MNNMTERLVNSVKILRDFTLRALHIPCLLTVQDPVTVPRTQFSYCMQDPVALCSDISFYSPTSEATDKSLKDSSRREIQNLVQKSFFSVCLYFLITFPM